MFTLNQAGCLSEKGKQTYYGRTKTPRSQQFRWSDGGLPQTFDPAFAAAPPDTDLIRAVFEGLTDYDPRTLQPVPAVASRWESSKDGKIWTFYLRDNARWSNGEPVTASDFVQSWERTVKLGDLAPHTELLRNIEGASSLTVSTSSLKTEARAVSGKNEVSKSPIRSSRLGAEALGAHVLRVRLRRPDLNFPALVAHPVFRPVKLDAESGNKSGSSDLISNGAFVVANAERDGVLLKRAETYWDKARVSLEEVAFVDAKNAEEALATYRDGEVDAVTNAAFEPLAIKLLSPFEDFRRATYGALIYYSFNTSHTPFDDVRVREALAISIDRDRISQDDLGGATEPAKRFLPEEMSASSEPVIGKSELLEKDVARARELLAQAGFPDGQGFPRIRLLVNRNEQQRLVAQSVAAMWRSALNVETEIVMKNWDDYESAIRAGDYDLIRRGLVMQTTDELTNMRMMFRPENNEMPLHDEKTIVSAGEASLGKATQTKTDDPIESEDQALRQLKAVPIYFASSYALVKPYVSGFDSNILDAPSLKNVKVDTTWTETRGK